ncbi:MAG TPA: GNAT family N-acetyltransferase [Hyphomicrobiales bacterium]|nr:GNAT family N-acetyltransferase [Kaistiaceae bacterium]HQF29889.1 GNAT family N-acetyltransferase [Hyphomicrobiales bacterium]
MLETGYHDVPAGKIASVVTYLEMTAAPLPGPAEARPVLELAAVPAPDIDWYRGLYRAIGTDWLWFSRVVMPAADLAAILADPAVEVFVARDGGRDIGLVELDRRIAGEVELAFFGLVPDAVGTGVGRWMMSRALELAWKAAPARVWVHTCTLDHPAALAFYIRSGFVPYRYAVEIADDPRLGGALPADAARHVPIIG